MKSLLTTILAVLLLVKLNEACEPAIATCVTEFYSFGSSEGDFVLHGSVYVSSPSIMLSQNFHFYNHTITAIYVGDNGVIGLNNPYNPSNPTSLPIQGRRLIVPYWADTDLRGTGEIYYRQTRNPVLLARATNEIQRAFSMSQDVIVTNLVIVTWNAVGYFYRGTDKTNTFQCILATTLTESFVIFLYADGEIQWTTGDTNGGFNGLNGTEALAGINAGDGVNHITIPGSLTPSIINITQTSNVGIPGVWMFKVGEGQLDLSPNIYLQPSGFDQTTVGQRQDVICSIYLPPDVDPDSIELSWDHEEEFVTNDSRVTIIESHYAKPSNIPYNIVTTIIRFDPLYEDDEGNYTCYLIVNESETFTSMQLQNFRIPDPNIQIYISVNDTHDDYNTTGQSVIETLGNVTLVNVTIGDPLTLDCTVTAVRGISSSVDIIWFTESIVRTVANITADIENDCAIYTDSFEISSLSTLDNGKQYYCRVVINAYRRVINNDQVTIIFLAPVCFTTPYCGGEFTDDSYLSFHQCCYELSGISFVSPGLCSLCPKSDCTIDEVKDVVFVIERSSNTDLFLFQTIREFVDNITVSLKLNSPESSVAVILYDHTALIHFDLEAYTSLSTLSLAINPGLPHNLDSGRDTAAALRLLLSSAQNGSLGIRNETSNIAIVITTGRSDDRNSTQSAAAALHAANIFDVYAIGYELADINELNTIASDPHFVYYTHFYRFNIADLQMNITDQLCSLPVPRISLQPRQGSIGEMQDITCSVTITSEIDPDLVELTWTLDDNNITADNRVTIITNITENPSSFTYTTIIQFVYLMEGDEGNYACNVKVDDMMESQSIILENLRLPRVVVEVTSIDSLEYGETTTLECNATTVRGITSRVDIIWMTEFLDTIVRRVDVRANIVGNSTVYTDQLVTPPLSIDDNGTVYYCVFNISTATYRLAAFGTIILSFADVDECLDNNGNCSHNCVNTNGSYYCECPTGFILQSDNHSCEDIDECLDNNGMCSHKCGNTEGSYHCECPPGYILQSNKRDCEETCEVNKIFGKFKKKNNRKVTLTFSADHPDATFECKVDNKKFKHCTSPRTLKKNVDSVTVRAFCVVDGKPKLQKRRKFTNKI